MSPTKLSKTIEGVLDGQRTIANTAQLATSILDVTHPKHWVTEAIPISAKRGGWVKHWVKVELERLLLDTPLTSGTMKTWQRYPKIVARLHAVLDISGLQEIGSIRFWGDDFHNGMHMLTFLVSVKHHHDG